MQHNMEARSVAAVVHGVGSHWKMDSKGGQVDMAAPRENAEPRWPDMEEHLAKV